MFKHDIDNYNKKFTAFGWNTLVVDGHNVCEIVKALEAARKHKGSPTMIIAKTMKGKYFGEDISNKVGWHGKPMK